MTRMSKQGKRRNMCPRKNKASFAEKTGSKKDNLKEGYRVHENALQSQNVFIGKVR